MEKQKQLQKYFLLQPIVNIYKIENNTIGCIGNNNGKLYVASNGSTLKICEEENTKLKEQIFYMQLQIDKLQKQVQLLNKANNKNTK